MWYPPQHRMPNPDEGVLHDALHPKQGPDDPTPGPFGPSSGPFGPPGGGSNRDPNRHSWLRWVILILYVILLGVAFWVAFKLT